MKRLLLTLFVAFVSLSTMAQTYLTNVYKPTASNVCTTYPYNGPSSKKLLTAGNISWYGGFKLGRHYLVKEAAPFATFNIGGKYDKMTFVMGPSADPEDMGVDKFIVTVKVDGRKVFDKVINGTDAAQRYTINVKDGKEITFDVVQDGNIVTFAEVVLWKAGETPRPLQNPEKAAAGPAQLIKDIPCYYSNPYMILAAPEVKQDGFGRKNSSDPQSISINGQSYPYALLARADMAIIGNMTAWAYFNLQKKYSTFRFKLGTVGAKSDGSGWVAVAADGKTIYEKEWNADDVPEEVTLDVSGCESLKIWTEDSGGWSQRIGMADMMVYPKGMEPARPADAEVGAYGALISKSATIDPKLKALPDVCPLMSNIAPYSRKSSVDKQIYDGTSDYLTFSMGGERFSEGFVLIKRPWFFDESTDSNVNFDLGNEFDYISFTAGFIGKSWYMNKDVLRVYADDKPVLIDTLYGTMMNRHYVVPINKCRKLSFECRGYGSIEGSSAFGCGDLVLYRGEPKENDLFVHSRPECPPEIDLIDLGGPYLHFASSMEESKSSMCLKGESLRNFYTLPNGEKIYKGFVLQTSSHFSLDAGVLGVLSNDPDDPNAKNKDAMGGVIGAAAVGSAFIPVGAVGGTMVGATMTGAAAFMVIASGGTAVESSCAAFNTYGEYNSLTFTVACLNANPGLLAEKKSQEEVKADESMYDPEKLLIGSNGDVIAELSVFPAMEPQTVTLPITDCEQLMFFLANTHGTSGIFVFYDLKLSKEKKERIIPEDARAVKAHITEIRCDRQARKTFLDETKWSRPKFSGAKELDAYLRDVSNLYEKTVRYAKEIPDYTFETYYLETESGNICKAVRIKTENGRGYFSNYMSSIKTGLKDLTEMKQAIVSLTMQQASAALDLPALGLGAIAYGKIFKECNAVFKNCKAMIEILYNEKMEEARMFQMIESAAGIIDGKESTDKIKYCPLFTGETVPEEAGVTPLRNFYEANTNSSI